MTPDLEDLDPINGWVSVMEIRNVFVEFLRQLDRDIFPEGEVHRALKWRCIKHMETCQHELYRRAKRNYRDFLLKEPKRKASEKVELPLTSKEAHAHRLAEISRKSII